MLKRGQTATETLIILSVVLLVLVLMIAINQDILRSYDSKFKVERTMAALNDIANAAELVYQQGVGAKTKIFVSFPKGLSNASISGNITKFTFTNNNIIQRSLGFNVSGNVTVTEGSRWIALESLLNFVNISDTTG